MDFDRLTASIDPVAHRQQPNRSLDLLLINLGGHCFGLPLSEVRHICSMSPDFAAYGPETQKHFAFQDSPLPYISLWDRLNLKSEYAEYEEILALLAKRRQDHIDWMNALEDAIRKGTTFSKARNPRECAFGKWYYAYQTGNQRLLLLMRYLEKPHIRIHCLADELLKLVEAGRVSDALRLFQESKNTTLVELLELFDSTQDLVATLQKRIAVIIDDSDNACALGADDVQDIVAVPPERIKPNVNIGAQATSNLVILDDQTLIPLIDWRRFFSKR